MIISTKFLCNILEIPTSSQNTKCLSYNCQDVPVWLFSLAEQSNKCSILYDITGSLEL